MITTLFILKKKIENDNGYGYRVDTSGVILIKLNYN